MFSAFLPGSTSCCPGFSQVPEQSLTSVCCLHPWAFPLGPSADIPLPLLHKDLLLSLKTQALPPLRSLICSGVVNFYTAASVRWGTQNVLSKYRWNGKN